MKILFLGYKNCRLYNFLSSRYDVIQTEDKIKIEDVKNVDYVISFGYKHIIGEDIICITKNPIINLHISYLPYNRGYHPNFWSFLEDTPKGVTIHYIDAGIDTGEIILQKEIVFDEEENTLAKTYNRLIGEIQDLFINNYNFILSGDATSTPQKNRGTFHLEKDLEKHTPLLTKGWDTETIKINNLNLREIDFNDGELLLEWRNDIITRKNSKSQAIVAKEDHKKWLEKTILNSPHISVFILEDKGVPVGTIRSNKMSGNEYELSWTISPDYRRQGYGTKILKLFLLNKTNTFIARIMPQNEGSILMAKRNGFKLCGRDGQFSIYKKNMANKKRTDLEIIDEVESVRAKNNVNWMDILRLAFKHVPEDSRKLMGKVNEYDFRISQLLTELSNNGGER